MSAAASKMDELVEQDLAVRNGPQAVGEAGSQTDLFHWPIVTEEDEQAVLEVLRDGGRPSGTDISMQLESEVAAWHGVKHGLTYPNGTLALQTAFWAAGVRRGDEIIVPSITYWASAMPAFALGATVVYADIDAATLCIDPNDIERHISPRTKAIVPVHYCGHPCDMDAILPIAQKHGLKVIEDVSHAQGTLYKGRIVGSFGDAAAFSMMSAKSFAAGEGGMLITDDDGIQQHAIAYAHYARHETLEHPDLAPLAGIPFGGIKGRLNQMCSAVARVQFKYYPDRIKNIQAAINRFWDLLADTPGLRAHRPAADSGSTMGGWYSAVGHYLPEELGDLPAAKFCEAVRAEGSDTNPGCNFPLHLHPVMNDVDIYGDGKPTRIANSDRDLRQPEGSLPAAEAAHGRVIHIPYLKHDRPEAVEQHAAAFRKVALQADKLV
ncbi:MAG TPA: hypothetical protein DIT01_16540 [Lentisphaeria bacterium]|nr:hypothetical protein [Lentisphaeria bacterium]